MSERSTASAPGYRGTLAGDGRPGPIEQRIGRRLVRLIDPESDEGLELLVGGRVELTGPDGENLGQLPWREAYDRLEHRLEERLDGATPDGEEEHALADGLNRLRAWSDRISQT